METYTSNKQRGLIRTVVLIFIFIIILSILGIDLKATIESEMAQKNIGYVKATIITVWNVYLEEPAKAIWNLLVKILTRSSTESTGNTEPTSMEINYEVANMIEITP